LPSCIKEIQIIHIASPGRISELLSGLVAKVGSKNSVAFSATEETPFMPEFPVSASVFGKYTYLCPV
jgi:hypothetical protein